MLQWENWAAHQFQLLAAVPPRKKIRSFFAFSVKGYILPRGYRPVDKEWKNKIFDRFLGPPGHILQKKIVIIGGR